jgi:membrane associated rhomboid family serine protease
MFIYENPFHMLLDAFLLLIFGRIVERHLGAARFLFLYFSSGVAVALYHALHLLFSCPLSSLYDNPPGVSDAFGGFHRRGPRYSGIRPQHLRIPLHHISEAR